MNNIKGSVIWVQHNELYYPLKIKNNIILSYA